MRTKKDINNLNSWNEALSFIKKNAPKGLYEQWEQLEPIAISPFVDGIYNTDGTISDNSYNWLDSDNNNIVFQSVRERADFYENKFIWVAFHISGDVRGNYTDYFLFKVDDVESLLMGFDNETWKEMGGEVE